MRKYTDQQFIEAAKTAKSIASLLRMLGIVEAGGNYIQTKKKLQLLKVDTSHWTGQGWNKDQRTKDWKNYSNNHHLKKNLIKVRGHECESCSLEQWLMQPITLELEHIDGDRTNNKLENLKLLCPNCHSQTKTWRRRKQSLH